MQGSFQLLLKIFFMICTISLRSWDKQNHWTNSKHHLQPLATKKSKTCSLFNRVPVMRQHQCGWTSVTVVSSEMKQILYESNYIVLWLNMLRECRSVWGCLRAYLLFDSTQSFEVLFQQRRLSLAVNWSCHGLVESQVDCSHADKDAFNKLRRASKQQRGQTWETDEEPQPVDRDLEQLRLIWTLICSIPHCDF